MRTITDSMNTATQAGTWTEQRFRDLAARALHKTPQRQPANLARGTGGMRSDFDLNPDHEAVKEIAQLDGAIIVSADGMVERACQIVDASHANLTLSKGLGTRHWAGAAISRVTKAIAVVVSQTNGTVRLFINGEVMLRIEPFRRAMKWKDFDYEPPSMTSE